MTWLKKKTKLKLRSTSERSVLKEKIQAALRKIGILRDGGCFARHYPEMGKCGGFTKDGVLILQFDHLNSRAHAVSYSDSRLGVTACVRHHIYFKRQYPSEYEKCATDFIGPERAALLGKVRADKSPHKVDLKLELIALEKEYDTLKVNLQAKE